LFISYNDLILNRLPLSEKHGVGSSILPLTTINIGSIGLHKQEKIMTISMTTPIEKAYKH